MDLILDYKSLDRLYNEINIIDQYGCAERQQDLWKRSTESFIGIPVNKESIEMAKYRYPRTLPKRPTNVENDYGCSVKTKVYSEYDGYDMNMERLHDGLPYLHNIVKQHGKNVGKFVRIVVNVAENCNIEADQMIIKADTAITILDMLEEQGKRVEIVLADATEDPGWINGKEVDLLYITTVIKKFEDTLNRQLIATSISPWLFRYHLLALYDAKMRTRNGHGHAISIPKRFQDPENIYIDNLQCLNKHDSGEFIERITKKRE